ncbi:IS21-like element helper ATPase IstB [Clostridium sp. AWRP]|uniref:IS21-like element helper ATPase IstB n=1 Tax=Clostridium sp. AWRP TaxID=2212991 RepID=UPI000FD89AA3|nr:IS21-like element helper ATPase IstB [Clostridium sp. AWRP]AZV57880.1 AAA family ATPase [Clostridium sp. AWRP]
MKIKFNEEIKEFCNILKLRGIHDHFEEVIEESRDYEEFLHKLLLLEIDEKDKRGVECRIRNAKFPYRKYLDDIDIKYLPEGMQKKLPELSTLAFIEKGQNVILVGNPGTGKTHVSIGLGIKACMEGYKVLFTTIPLLITKLKECNSQKTLTYFERRFEKYDLVIADELGYISFDKEGAELLFTNLSLRASRKSIIITTNLSFDRWEEIFADPVITSAMVDRLTHKAHIIDMTGDSYRLHESLSQC